MTDLLKSLPRLTLYRYIIPAMVMMIVLYMIYRWANLDYAWILRIYREVQNIILPGLFKIPIPAWLILGIISIWGCLFFFDHFILNIMEQGFFIFRFRRKQYYQVKWLEAREEMPWYEFLMNYPIYCENVSPTRLGNILCQMEEIHFYHTWRTDYFALKQNFENWLKKEEKLTPLSVNEASYMGFVNLSFLMICLSGIAFSLAILNNRWLFLVSWLLLVSSIFMYDNAVFHVLDYRKCFKDYADRYHLSLKIDLQKEELHKLVAVDKRVKGDLIRHSYFNILRYQNFILILGYALLCLLANIIFWL